MSPRRVRGREDCLLQKKLSLRGITWEYCWGRTLIHKEDLPFEADLNLIWSEETGFWLFESANAMLFAVHLDGPGLESRPMPALALGTCHLFNKLIFVGS